MAQIKKHQKGGNIKTPTYGKFIKDGVEYDVDETRLQELYAHANSLDSDAAYQFGRAIIEPLKAGKTLLFDSAQSTLQGNDEFDVKNQDKMTNRQSEIGKTWNALWGTKVHDSKLAIDSLKNFSFSEKPIEKTVYDYSRQLTPHYTIETKDGKTIRTYSNDVDGQTAISRLESLANLNNLEGDFVGYNNWNKDDYYNWYSSFMESNPDIINQIKSGTYTDNQIAALADIGIILNSDAPQIVQTTSTQTTQQPTARNAGSSTATNIKLSKGSDGNNYWTDNENNIIEGLDGNKNYWLNERFIQKYPQYAKWFEEQNINPAEGLFLINGEIIRGDDEESLESNTEFNRFVEENRKFGGNASNIIQYYSGEDSGYNTADNTRHSLIPELNSRYSRDVTGDYQPLSAPGLSDQFTPYLKNSSEYLLYEMLPDYNDANKFDRFGHALEEFKEYLGTTNGSSYSINNLETLGTRTPEEAAEYYANTKNSAFFPVSQMNTVGESGMSYNMANIISDKTGNLNILKDINTGKYYYDNKNPLGASNFSGNFSGKIGDYAIEIPEELVKEIIDRPERLDSINFRNYLEALLLNPYRRKNDPKHTVNSDWSLNPSGPNVLYSSWINDPYINAFMDNMRTNKISFNNFNTGLYQNDPNAISRLLRFRNTDNSQIQKNQLGNKIRVRRDNITNHELTSGSRKRGEHKKMNSNSSVLTSADWMELGAIVGDLATMTTSVIPGVGNAVTAGVGAAASTSKFGADISRDGFQLGDLGNYAMNLGLDAISLIPIAGAAGKSAKIVKNLKNAGKLIGTLASAGALSSAAVHSYNKIVDGEKWTLEDISIVTNALTAAVNAKNLGGTKTIKGTSKRMPSKQFEETFKTPEISLTKEEIKAVKELPKENQLEILSDLIKVKTNKDIKSTPIDIVTSYGFPITQTKGSKLQLPFEKGKTWIPKLRKVTKSYDHSIPQFTSWIGSNKGIIGGNAFGTTLFNLENQQESIYKPIYKNGGIIKYQNGGGVIGNAGKVPKLNIDAKNMLDLASLWYNARSINKSAEIQQKGLKKAFAASTQQYTPEFYSQFTDYGLGRQTQDSLNSIRNINDSGNIHSDTSARMADMLTRDLKAESMKRDFNMQLSNTKTQYDADTLERKVNSVQNQTNVRNYNKQLEAKKHATSFQIEAGRQEAHHGNRSQHLNQGRIELGNRRTQKDALESQLYSQKSQMEYAKSIQDLRNKYQSEYSTWLRNNNSHDVYKNYTLDQFISEFKNGEVEELKYNTQRNSLIGPHNNLTRYKGIYNIDPTLWNYINPQKSTSAPIITIKEFKSGGKIENQMEKVNNDILKESQENIDDSLKLLNKNVMNLILELIS